MLTCALSISFQPHLSLADKNSSDTLTQAQKAEVDDWLANEPENNPNEEQAFAQWADIQTEELGLVFRLAAELEEDAIKLKASIGEEKFLKLVEKDKYKYKNPQGLGRAEYKIIKGEPSADGKVILVPRVLLANNEKAHFLLDKSLISPQSAHLRQIRARTHHEAGEGRLALDAQGQPIEHFWTPYLEKLVGKPDIKEAKENNEAGTDTWLETLAFKHKTGRDGVWIWVGEGSISNIEQTTKPKPRKWRWWSEYFFAKYKSPTKDDFTQALFTGFFMQGALAMVLSGAKSYFLQDMPLSLDAINWGSVSVISTYGLTLGTFMSTYQNWMLSKSKTKRFFKSLSNSLAFALAQTLVLTPGGLSDRFFTVDITENKGRQKVASILSASTAQSLNRSYTSEISNIDRVTRENQAPFEITIAGKKVISWNRGNLKASMLSLIPISINLATIMLLSDPELSHIMSIPGTNVQFPFLHVAWVPFAMYWAKIKSERMRRKAMTDPELAPYNQKLTELSLQHDKAWQSSFTNKILEFTGIKPAAVYAYTKASMGFQKTKTFCNKLLSSQASEE